MEKAGLGGMNYELCLIVLKTIKDLQGEQQVNCDSMAFIDIHLRMHCGGLSPSCRSPEEQK